MGLLAWGGVAAGILVILVVTGIVVRIFADSPATNARNRGQSSHSSSSPWSSSSSSTTSSFQAPIGYSGTAATTGKPASAWTQGVSTAWTLPFTDPTNADDDHVKFALIDGDLIVAENANHGVTVTAYDITGSQPEEKWQRTDQSIYIRFDDEIAPWQDYIVVDTLLLDRKTGEKADSPWGIGTDITVFGDVLVACDLSHLCRGWTSLDNRIWENQFKSTSEMDTTTAGTGDDLWVTVADRSKDQLRALSIRTGALSPFQAAPEYPSISSNGPIIPASDGWIVYETATQKATMLNLDGTIKDSFTATDSPRYMVEKPVLSSRLPSLDELKAFLADSDVSWAEGSYRFSGEKCDTLQIKQRKAQVDKDLSLASGVGDYCFSRMDSLSLSEDEGVALIRSDALDDGAYFVDMFNSKVLGADQSSVLKHSELVYDDLFVGTASDRLVALTPTH